MALPICTAWENSSAWVSVSSAEEGRAVDAVLTGAPAEATIRSPGFALALPSPPESSVGACRYAAEHQRVADVAVVEVTAPLMVGMPIRLP